MNTNDLMHFKAWFADYVAAYYRDDAAHNQIIKLKQEHTERVCKEIVMLGKALDLAPEDILLAETIALFHDIGRFKQYAVYGTFKDSISENHAKLGLKELAGRQVLSICSDIEQTLITKAIRYHNVRTLRKDEDERCLFFARLVRDADKLDIWRIFIDYYEHQDEQANSSIVWGLPNNDACSPRIINALSLKKMADTRHMATLNDFRLLQISWVFDVNYGPTLRAVRERRYVEKIAAYLPQTTEIQQLLAMVQAYLEEQESASS
jgi:HD superfamily phosphohydrolase YqeK